MAPVDRLTRFSLIPERSAVVVEATSNVGPIMFGTSGITGEILAVLSEGSVDPGTAAARLEVRVDLLASGNHLYDSELRRRIDARRFPRSTVELHAAARRSDGAGFDVTGDIVFHGVRRTLTGGVTVTVSDGPRLVVTGEELVDIRDFAMAPPTMLMLKIEPEVNVRLHVEAAADEVS